MANYLDDAQKRLDEERAIQKRKLEEAKQKDLERERKAKASRAKHQNDILY